MKAWIKVVAAGLLTYGALFAAEQIGYARGFHTVSPAEHPNLFTSLCFDMGREIGDLKKSPENAALIARVKIQCVNN